MNKVLIGVILCSAYVFGAQPMVRTVLEEVAEGAALTDTFVADFTTTEDMIGREEISPQEAQQQFSRILKRLAQTRTMLEQAVDDNKMNTERNAQLIATQKTLEAELIEAEVTLQTLMRQKNMLENQHRALGKALGEEREQHQEYLQSRTTLIDKQAVIYRQEEYISSLRAGINGFSSVDQITPLKKVERFVLQRAIALAESHPESAGTATVQELREQLAALERAEEALNEEPRRGILDYFCTIQ